MKKLTLFTVWLVLAVILTFSPPVSADIIFPSPPDSHHLDWYIKVVNLDEFPEIVLICSYPVYTKGQPLPRYGTYQIENDKAITAGDPLVPISIYWNTKDKGNSIDSNNLLMTIGLNGGYIPNSNPLVKETFEYSISGFSGNKLMIYKSRHISEYNDGTPAKVETLPNPWSDLILTPTPPSLPVPNPPPTQVTPTTQVPQDLWAKPTNVTAPPPTGGVNVNIGSVKERFWQSWAYEQQFLFALLLTLVIEIPVAIVFLKALFKRREISIGKIILIGLLASALTLPYLWFILPAYISNRALYIWLGEASVILVEAVIYYRFLKLRLLDAGMVSLIANVASVVVGLVLV